LELLLVRLGRWIGRGMERVVVWFGERFGDGSGSGETGREGG
jgi:hypothetical protein